MGLIQPCFYAAEMEEPYYTVELAEARGESNSPKAGPCMSMALRGRYLGPWARESLTIP